MNTLISGTTVVAVTVLASISLIMGKDQEIPPTESIDSFVSDLPGGGAPVELPGDGAVRRSDLVVDLVTGTKAGVPEDGGDIRFCIPLVFPDATCLPRDRIIALEDKPIDRLTVKGPPKYTSLMMVHPSDFTEPEREVRTCEVFGRLRADEWGPMTTRGQAAAATFERYCGLIALARVARTPRTSRFSEAGMTEAEIEAIPGEAWPVLGERLGLTPIFTRDAKEKRRWEGNTETLILSVYDVATADFDDDGFAERLLAVAGRARGGSAGFAQFMLVEHDDKGVGLRAVVWE
ncbi:MAG: hypothetical protein AAGA69_07460 [Pseudomonadota bacterium]